VKRDSPDKFDGVKKRDKLRVLVVDDSAFMRRIIGDIIASQPDMELAGIARHGEEALKKREKIAPDLLTMDLDMPFLDGMSTLKRLMAQNPVPVIIVSSHTREGSESTLEALSAGAVDFVPKPTQRGSGEALEELKKTLPMKIRAAATARLDIVAENELAATSGFRTDVWMPTVEKDSRKNRLVLAIGASTGGPRAIEETLGKLPPHLPAAIMVTQHMPSGFTKSFAGRLNMTSPFKVKEAQSGDQLKQGEVFIAPGNYHLIWDVQDKLALHQGERVHHVRPAFDVMLESLVASSYGVIAVVLTGMGKDGSLATVKLKKQKEFARVIVQEPATSIVRGMPEAVIKTGCQDQVVPLSEISREIVNAAEELQKEMVK